MAVPHRVSVKDFGAVGDGSANDTHNLQTALDSGAGVVDLPAGRYLSDALTVPNGVQLISGEGELVQRSLDIGRGSWGLYGGGLMNIANVTGLTVDGLKFTGIRGPSLHSENSAVYV